MDDPTADFLAREQAILGADAALFDNPITSDIVGEEGFDSTPFQPAENLVFEDPSVNFESNNQDSSSFFDPSMEISPAFPLPPKQQFSQVIETPKVLEPSKEMIAWQERFEQQISERDQKESEKHERVLKEAKDALDRFYAEYNEKKEKAIQKNKELERNLIATRTQKLQGNVWVSNY